ncbi:MAG: hypothetical protein ACT4NU_08365 [Chromatiales bacterium]
MLQRFLYTLPLFPSLVLLTAAGGPGELTDETRLAMMESARKYDACLHREADALMNDNADVRNVTDAAMKRCDTVLEEVGRLLSERGLPEDLRAGYLRHTRNSTARKLLPELMARRAAEQAASEP